MHVNFMNELNINTYNYMQNAVVTLLEEAFAM